MAAACVAACSTGHTTPPSNTSVVVGIVSDDMSGKIGSLHVVAQVDGQTKSDEALSLVNAMNALPHEVKLAPAQASGVGHVSVKVDGYTDATYSSATSSPPIVTRLAETDFVPGENLLLRLRVEVQCVLAAPGSTGPGGPSCTSPQTCIGGICEDDHVASNALEPYTPGWASEQPDICKPAGAGAPVVMAGTGQTDYLPLTDGQTLKMELGPQGGHHIWIASRMKNLAQSGSITSIHSQQPGGIMGPDTSFVFTYDRDEGGFCKIAGLRYQLDTMTDYHQFLGKPLDVTLGVKDRTGLVGTATVHINIDPMILCPGSMPNCNM